MKRKKAPEKGEKKKKRRGILRLFRWGAPVPIVLLLGVGAALFAVPAEHTRALSIVTGAILALAAFLLLLTAFVGNGSILQLLPGTAIVALAVWLFIQPDAADSALFYVITGVVLLRSLTGLFYSLVAGRKDSRLWQISMAGSILLLVCAVVCFFLPMAGLKAENILLGALCCFNAVFESAALLHRMTSRGGEEKSDAPKKKRKEQPEEAPAPEPIAPPEKEREQETEKKGSFWQRMGRKRKN